MGNCCRKGSSSSMEWADDDWGSLRSSSSMRSSNKVFDEGHAWNEMAPAAEKKQLLGEMRASSSLSDHNGKVTIKISKKELEELMASVGKNKEREGSSRGSSSAEQVLVRLLSARDHLHHHAHSGPWRPALQSIPELD